MNVCERVSNALKTSSDCTNACQLLSERQKARMNKCRQPNENDRTRSFRSFVRSSDRGFETNDQRRMHSSSLPDGSPVPDVDIKRHSFSIRYSSLPSSLAKLTLGYPLVSLSLLLVLACLLVWIHILHPLDRVPRVSRPAPTLLRYVKMNQMKGAGHIFSSFDCNIT